MSIRDALEAARQVKSSCLLVGEGFFVNQVCGTCGTDCSFVQPHCVKLFSTLDPGQLSPDERGAAGKTFGQWSAQVSIFPKCPMSVAR